MPNVSLNTLAIVLSLISGQCVSKQGVDKRVSPRAVIFVANMLLAALHAVSRASHIKNRGAFSSFNRVLIQDSTNFRLPDFMGRLFPGSRNQSGKSNSILKIQLIYELIEDKVHRLSLSGFTRNDQEASGDILDHAQSGDLVLRDLGYFSTPTFKSMDHRGISFLTRLAGRVSLYDPDTGARLDLRRELKKTPVLDRRVLMGSRDKMLVRLVAAPAPESVANERRRKAKDNRDKRNLPSRETLYLLGWEIFITNVGEDVWSAETASKVYFSRWRIELIFKVWKSHFRMRPIPRGSTVLVLICILARLLYLVWFHNLYSLLNQRMADLGERYASIQKLSDFSNAISACESLGIDMSGNLQLHEEIIQTLCVYEKRKRLNHFQKLEALS